ncbi:MFS transporter [Paenibacillus sp. JDR-2]|uniref:MFS transporter n=1 Tax=Paenibacillus sp. (strain JDR-2) TaxID=324057 RepID=UPI0001663C8B|nr:MFS transporter [Paenibacillus sp. JDR-2]ACT01685.1 major facilitator superfamily MFS_1 [Paenibacillus sp. JDR-2]
MKRIVWLSCLAYFLVGLATVAFGALLPELLQVYGKSYSSGGQLVFAQFAGFFLGVVLTPRLTVLFGYPRTIWLGMLFLVMAQALLFFSPMWALVIILAVLNGCGFGMTQTALGTYLLEISDQAAVTMSRLEVAFGVGALFMPLISSVLIAQAVWEWSFGIIALLALVNLLFWSRKAMGTPVIDSSSIHPLPTTDNTMKSKKTPIPLASLVYFTLFVFLYVGLETSLINFLPSIFSKHFSIHASNASLSVTLFWVAMIIGRFFSGYLAERIRYNRFLLVSAIGAGLCLVCMPVMKHSIAAFALVLLTGLFLSGIFAILIVYANSVFEGNTKQITSILIASGGIGGAILPLVIGWCMDRISTSSTLVILAACSFLLLICLYRIRMNLQSKAAQIANKNLSL